MFDWIQDPPLIKLMCDAAFIITRILRRPDVQGKWFNANIKLIKRMRMMLVLGHILNKIFKMKYETHAYGIEFEIENVFKK